MKNLVISAIILFSSFANAGWKMTPVQGKEQVVGYIYSVDAEGTPKSFTSLRFICSTKGGEPVLALLWAKGVNTGPTVTIDITVDNKIIFADTLWAKDETLIYRPISESVDLITVIKNSRLVKFQFHGISDEKYTTGFVSSGIDLVDFNSKCKL